MFGNSNHRYAVKGEQTDVYFAVQDNTTSASYLYAGADIVAGDFKVSKDGGATANVTNLPTHVGNGIRKIVLTAAEMGADQIILIGQDASAQVWNAVIIVIQTRLRVGTIVADATGVGGNVAGFSATGVGTAPGIAGIGAANAPGIKGTGQGTGSGIEGAAGATGHGMLLTGGATSGDGLRATTVAGLSYGIHAMAVSTGAAIFGDASGGSNATGITGFGSGNASGITGAGGTGGGTGITGTGNGAAAGIQGVGGTTGHGFFGIGGATSGHGFFGQATASGYGFFGQGAGGGTAANFGGAGASLSWDDLEGGEPTAAIAANATFRQILQHLKRSQLNAAEESSTLRTIFRDDSVTPLETQVVSTAAATKTRGRAT